MNTNAGIEALKSMFLGIFFRRGQFCGVNSSSIVQEPRDFQLKNDQMAMKMPREIDPMGTISNGLNFAALEQCEALVPPFRVIL